MIIILIVLRKVYGIQSHNKDVKRTTDKWYNLLRIMKITTIFVMHVSVDSRWKNKYLCDIWKVNLNNLARYRDYLQRLQKKELHFASENVKWVAAVRWYGLLLDNYGKANTNFLSNNVDNNRCIQSTGSQLWEYKAHIADNNYIFQQNNAEIRTAKSVNQYFKLKIIKVLDRSACLISKQLRMDELRKW